MTNAHAASILEIMSSSVEEKTGKGEKPKKFSIFKLACTIFQDDGQITVGTHDMFVDGHEVAGEKAPRAGFFYPRYEPRCRWDSPSFSGVIVELVPVPPDVVRAQLQKRYGAVPAANIPAAVKP